MNESHANFSLIDIMRGVHALGLYTKLPDAQFKFLMGLILQCNELAFKNPMELTNSDALALCECETRQGLNQLRKRLARQRLYGEWFIKVTPGDRWVKRSSTYRINLNFLSSQGKLWQRSAESWSTGVSQDVDQVVSQDVSQDIPVSSLDQIRGDPDQERARAREGAGEEAVAKLDIDVEIRKREQQYSYPHDWIWLVGDNANRILRNVFLPVEDDTEILKQALINASLDEDTVLRTVYEAKEQKIAPREALVWVRDQLGGAP